MNLFSLQNMQNMRMQNLICIEKEIQRLNPRLRRGKLEMIFLLKKKRLLKLEICENFVKLLGEKQFIRDSLLKLIDSKMVFMISHVKYS
jgi:hypothetical protein